MLHCAKLFPSCLFVTLWTVACQVPLSMGFSRQEFEFQSGLEKYKLMRVTVFFQLKLVVKNLPAKTQEMQVWSLGWEDPLEEVWQPTPVFLPGESHGQRSLAGYSPGGCQESDTPEHLTSLIHSGVFLPGVSSESAIHIHIPPLFRFFSHIQVIAEYWVEFPVLYGRSLLVIYHI